MFMSTLVDRIAGAGADGFQVSERAVEMIAAGRDVVLLCLGDPDFATPPHVIQAAVTALRSGRTHYTPVAGEPALREAIAADQSSRDGRAWSADQVVVFPGAQSALFAAIMCVAERGRAVIALDPLYATYEAVVGASGAELVRVPVDISFGSAPAPAFDIEAFARAVPSHASAVLLNCPNNPGGYVLAAEALRDIVALCVERDLWLVADEVYRDLVFDGAHMHPGAFAGLGDRLILVNSLSKSHAMTGWRIGWAISGALAPHLARFAQCALFGSPPFIQDAAVAAIRDVTGSVAGFRDVFRRRRDVMIRALQASNVLSASVPAGGMFTLVDIRATGLDSATFAARALDEAGVAVVPGLAFSPHGGGYVRVSFAQSEDVLAEGARRLVAFAAEASTAPTARVETSVKNGLNVPPGNCVDAGAIECGY